MADVEEAAVVVAVRILEEKTEILKKVLQNVLWVGVQRSILIFRAGIRASRK